MALSQRCRVSRKTSEDARSESSDSYTSPQVSDRLLKPRMSISLLDVTRAQGLLKSGSGGGLREKAASSFELGRRPCRVVDVGPWWEDPQCREPSPPQNPAPPPNPTTQTCCPLRLDCCSRPWPRWVKTIVVIIVLVAAIAYLVVSLAAET